MSNDSADLLRILASGSRPGAVGAPAGVEQGSTLEAGQFAQLLEKARGGELGSNRPVTIAPEAAGKVKLSDDQLAKIALAADKAEAEGVRKALVVLDGQQVVLDVAHRTITGEAGLKDGAVLAGVDGVINLSKVFVPGVQKVPALRPPSGAVSSTSLAELLAGSAA
jgi:hypothetical protein